MMEKITEFLKDATPCFVATVDGDAPRVRPHGFSMIYDGKLCYCTADGKDTSKQLKANPNIEIASCKGTQFLRVRGKAEFIADEGAVKQALEIMPALAQMLRPGKLEVFAVTDGTAVISDLISGESETIEL